MKLSERVTEKVSGWPQWAKWSLLVIYLVAAGAFAKFGLPWLFRKIIPFPIAGVEVEKAERAREEPRESRWWAVFVRDGAQVYYGGRPIHSQPAGQPIYVVGSPSPGWYEIEYDFNPKTEHQVQAADVAPYTFPSREPREIQRKPFMSLGYAYNPTQPYNPSAFELGGYTFPNWTTFELLESTTERAILAGPDGRQLVFSVHDMPKLTWRQFEADWDVRNHVPACTSEPRSSTRAFLDEVGRFFIRPWVVFAAVLLLIGLKLLAAVGGRGRLITVVFPLLLLGFAVQSESRYVGPAGLAYRCELVGGWIAPKIAPDGRIRPFPYSMWVNPMEGAGQPSAVDQHTLFFILVLAFVYLAIRAIPGVHYLLVPHPVEKIVRAGPEIDLPAVSAELGQVDLDRPPLEFIVENKARRIRKFKQVLDDEAAFLESAIRLRRLQDAHRDTEAK